MADLHASAERVAEMRGVAALKTKRSGNVHGPPRAALKGAKGQKAESFACKNPRPGIQVNPLKLAGIGSRWASGVRVAPIAREEGREG